ncbi:hypothetical protein MTR67_051906 [Solanum verrucosum]|uniref:Reverse transcriptase domain-containing protein n=1 Tax=Solanum verrucosum TaxID=315347 RepID=A0AAF0V868_SOLVR|nr:hypothetical protein MTR67_051906 [Solanum verrucosum]
MEVKGPQINHLSFADDVIVFTSTDKHSMKLIMDTLEEYEHTSNQLINKEKSHFMVPTNTPQDIISTIQEVTGFSQKDSPITYLGCPLYIGRQMIIFYSQLVEKVSKKICGWKARILSFGGKITLIKHALQSIPIHTMKEEWGSEDSLMYVLICNINNGGHSDQDLLFGVNSLNPNTAREPIQLQRRGGALAKHTNHISNLNNATIAYFLVNGKRNERKLRQQVPPLLIPHILGTNFQYQQGVKDTAVWKPNESGKFSCASAWEICRNRRTAESINSQIWHKNIPFKMSFLIWRALRNKLPTNEKLATFGVEPVKCFYCIKQGWDEVDHIFIQGHFATHIWKQFSGAMGINFQQTSLINYLSNWSGSKEKNEAHKILIQTLPIVVCWNLWKNRCSTKYGGRKSSITRVKYMILKDILQLLRSVFPYILWPLQWTEVVDVIETCKHDIKVTSIRWKTPPPTRYKLNTDGSALHNPGKIGGGHGYNNIILEVDSELLTRWLLQTAIPPWRIQSNVQELQNLASREAPWVVVLTTDRGPARGPARGLGPVGRLLSLGLHQPKAWPRDLPRFVVKTTGRGDSRGPLRSS